MPEQLQKNFTIEIQEKLYEKMTPDGALAVYQTTPYGMLLTLDNQIMLSEQDGFFFHEMMTHPALFSHPAPQKIAILGNCFGILPEVLKHASVAQVCCVAENASLDEAVSRYFSGLYAAKNDSRVTHDAREPMQWLMQSTEEHFDVIIDLNLYAASSIQARYYERYHQVLRGQGILIQACRDSLLQLKSLKTVFENIKKGGFNDWQMLNFPQPSYQAGWRTAMMVMKEPTFGRVREKDVYNRAFATRYYNLDTHKAALAVPEFMREEVV